jgi:alpha-ketoglutaric semialdehyde dehydrogenase
MTRHDVWINGRWRPADASGDFLADNPATAEPLPARYPISSWADLDEALDAASSAADRLAECSGDQIAGFLEAFAAAIERQAESLVAMAHAETALAVKPRLAEVELPRTVNQLREAARTAREGSWLLPTIDTKLGIRACHAPLGPVLVFGPNNFPLAFNSVSGGDFAAAIAAGNTVIAKANTSHPGTTRLLALAADDALRQCELPTATVQLLYRTSHEDGKRAVADPRLGASGYTGSRAAGLALKVAADQAGKPIYLELSSVNPLIILRGALRSRGDELAAEFASSCLMGSGQFCTNPGLVLLVAGPETDRFVASVSDKFQSAPVGTLLSKGVAQSLGEAVAQLTAAGAKLLAGGKPGGGKGYSFANTLLSASGAQFIANPQVFQTEAFGNASLLIIAADAQQLAEIVERLEGNLTGAIYSDRLGSDDAQYDLLAPRLHRRVGRLLNDKMPTGVAVSPAMNHGGPYPATGHPGFTAVGLPAAVRRFTALRCYDNVRPGRLPLALRDENPTGRMWRLVDGAWTQADVGG